MQYLEFVVCSECSEALSLWHIQHSVYIRTGGYIYSCGFSFRLPPIQSPMSILVGSRQNFPRRQFLWAARAAADFISSASDYNLSRIATNDIFPPRDIRRQEAATKFSQYSENRHQGAGQLEILNPFAALIIG